MGYAGFGALKDELAAGFFQRDIAVTVRDR
jgi:hypothetical protein